MSDAASTSAVHLKKQDQYNDRWSKSSSNKAIEWSSERLTPAELKRFEIFEPYKEKVLEKISTDIRVTRWKAGAVLFEEGAYIDLAFFVVSGEVEISVERLDGMKASAVPIFDADRTELNVIVRPPPKEAGPEKSVRGDRKSSAITMLNAIDVPMNAGETVSLHEGELFGEIGAMSGWPQSVTARAKTACELIQIRMPALLEMRKKPALMDRLKSAYRERSLIPQLRATPIFQDCNQDFLEEVANEVELISLGPGEVLAKEGDPADSLYLLRSGFLRLEQKFGESQIAVTYLSKGMTFGEVEHLVDGLTQWEVTARSVEYVELVKMNPSVLDRLFTAQPTMKARLWKSAIARVREVGFGKRNLGHSEFINVALEKGLVQGNSILVIDLETCTRCDDCVRGCAAAHEGRPRFVREGDRFQNLLLPKSCYHCRDPVCLVGCPTGAIRRTGIGEVVAIDENICIGCGTCAGNCPYDNIVMHDTGETWPNDMIPEGLRGEARSLASKCDLCQSADHPPACVSNCPQGCAHRVTSLDEFDLLLRTRG